MNYLGGIQRKRSFTGYFKADEGMKSSRILDIPSATFEPDLMEDKVDVLWQAGNDRSSGERSGESIEKGFIN